MLQFIVLGLVPGTHLQITFGWILMLLVSLTVVLAFVADLLWLRPFLLHKTEIDSKKQTAA